MKRNGRLKKFDEEKRRKRAEEELRRREDEIQREIHKLLGFWIMCKHRNCRRVQGCLGELNFCFPRNWPLVPAPERESFRAMLKASVSGASEEELMRIGVEAEARAEAAAKTAAR